MTDELECLASEIVDNFKGATVDHFGCCLMQEQIVKALRTLRSKTRKEDAEIAESQGLFLQRKVPDRELFSVKEMWVNAWLMQKEIAQAILKKEEDEQKQRREV